MAMKKSMKKIKKNVAKKSSPPREVKIAQKSSPKKGNNSSAKEVAKKAKDASSSDDEDNNDDATMETGDNSDEEDSDEVPSEEISGEAPSPNDDEIEEIEVESNEEGDEKKLEANTDNVTVEETNTDPYLLQEAAYIKGDKNWTNKQRTLVFASRGISGRDRHLMDDLKRIMPHHKTESKFEKTQDFKELNEVAELKSCNNVCFFEARKHTDLYMHMARVPHGPTCKFQVQNVHTSGEVRLSGNCLMYSRPLLTFDEPFDRIPHLQLMKEQFIQVFGTPRNHPKSKPFHDHVMSFFFSDNKIWVRHYQISPLTDADANDPEKQVLTEIGPRMVLNPIWVLQGSFSGRKIFHNPHYLSPTATRKQEKSEQGLSAKLRVEHKQRRDEEQKLFAREADPTEDIFKDQ